MVKLALRSLILSAVLLASTALASSGDSEARDFLIQKVCVDQSGNVLPLDPYACPAGDTLRSLEPGEALPYHRYDQPLPDDPADRQRHDSYPVRTSDGQEIVVNPFKYPPFGQYDPKRDGYSITLVRDGWASSGGTRTQLRGTTFFGAGCRPYGGWVYFPVSALDGHLIRPGEVQVPIKGDHWEANGEPWPGRCPSDYRTDTVTNWEPLPAFQFGGIGPTPIKTIDAIRSIHGFVDSPQFFAQGHLEVFYFTRLYGWTRWEVWVTRDRLQRDPGLIRRAVTASRRCIGPAETAYRGVVFERTACRDWTAVEVVPRPEVPPQRPVNIPRTACWPLCDPRRPGSTAQP